MKFPPTSAVHWRRAYRIIPSRYPPVGLFDRIAAPEDIDALFEIEGLTNARIREELGAIATIPAKRRIAGPGTTPIMAAFTHINPDGSRFSDGSYGVLYAANQVQTAIEETVYHRQHFLADAHSPAIDVEMRCYVMSIKATLHDVRGGWPKIHHRSSYAASQQLARELRLAGSDGIVFDSVRHAGGECAAAFYPDLIKPSVQSKHFLYRWDGARIDSVLEVAEVKLKR